MTENFNMLDVVALTRDIPSKNLMRGQVGTIVEKLSGSVVEVEFSDNHGEAYCIAPVSIEHLIVLHYHPIDNIAVA